LLVPADSEEKLRQEIHQRTVALETLVKEVRRFLTEPNLDQLLPDIVGTARVVTKAQYAALGLFDQSGGKLVRFLTAGLDEDTRAAIGKFPQGKGVLGAIPADGRALRIPDLSLHPLSVGFPSHHPPMKSFLGIAILSYGRLFGRMYLTNKQGRNDEEAEFTKLDEDFLTLFAAHVGSVVEINSLLQSIRSTKRQYRSALTSLPVPVVQINRALRIKLVNKAFCNLTNRDETLLLGYSLEEVLPLDGWNSYLRPLWTDASHVPEWEVACLLSPKASSPTLSHNLPDDSQKIEKLHTLRITASRLDSEEQDDLIVVIQDITKGKQLEKELRQTQKVEAIGRLAGGIAHDLNNLLTVITGHGNLGLLSSKKDDPAYGHIEKTLDAAMRASGLTKQLLTYSRAQILQPTILDLNEILVSISNMLRRVIGEDIDLCTECDPALASIKTDPTQIEQIVINLVINARHAMPDGGRLILQTRNVQLDESSECLQAPMKPGPYVQLVVQDTGCGMTQETLGHIFDPFFTTKGPEVGTGLGLSTVYGVVKQSGGSIVVTSQVGEGSRFTLSFPEAQTKEAMKASPEPQWEPSQGKGSETILLVEDELAIRMLLADVLRDHGYTVLETSDPREAVTIAQNHGGTITALVTDMIMPHMQGIHLAERLAATYPRLKVLFMSGYPASMSGMSSGQVGDRFPHFSFCTAYLQKPFSPAQFLREVRTLCDRP